MTDTAAAADIRAVKSAERTLVVLEILGREARPVPVVELHKLTGYPRSSLHQLLHTLAAGHWIEMSDDGAVVAIGAQALIVGTSYLERDRAIPFAAPVLEEIRNETGYTAHYARLEGDSVLYLSTRETTDSHRRISRIGRKLPAHSTSLGKALLSQLTESERDAVLGDGELVALTSSTITDREALDAQLKETRDRGYSIERAENTEGVVCVGVPVPYRIPATDAISCALPVERASAEEIARVAEILRRGANGLARTLQSQGVR